MTDGDVLIVGEGLTGVAHALWDMFDCKVRVLVSLVLVACGGCDSGGKAVAKKSETADRPIAHLVDGRLASPTPPREIELLHGSDAKVAVSSVVANSTIFPSDLVDGKMSTAWNSRTGDLVGSWIAFRVPTAAHVTRLRLTAGFADMHGGDDWFTMNYRIREVHVVRLGVDGDLGVHALDPSNRRLQDIPIDGPGGDFKILITGVVPGSKANWRETCVSELEVWGTLPAMTPARHDTPDVAIGSLDAEPLPDNDLTIDPLPSYASIGAFCKDYLARPAEKFDRCSGIETDCVVDGKRGCGEAAASPIALGKLPSGWKSARFFFTSHEHRKQKICNLAIAAGDKTYVLESVGNDTCGQASDIGGAKDRKMSRAETALKGDLLGLTTTTSGDSSPLDQTAELTERLWICSASEPACTSEILLGTYDTTTRSSGEPGADGIEISQVGWSLDWVLDGRKLALSHHDGTIPPDQRDKLGAHRLVLPSER